MPVEEAAQSAEIVAERLLQIIDEGRRTATYKLALLMALMDGCAENVGPMGEAPQELTTRIVARHVTRRYLPQARLYLHGEDLLQLRQITNKQSAVLGAITRLHAHAESLRCRTFAEVQREIPDELDTCLDEVERTFARYPIRLLQVVGSEHRPFLYDIDWSDSVSLRALHAPGGGRLRLRPGAGEHLIRLTPLLRPLVELHWARMVARINGIAVEDERLRGHLFGSERAKFPMSLRSGLRELQHDRCFYCGRSLSVGGQVDHFIPWSRWPNDAVENLVLADICNGQKSDYLAGGPHIGSWMERIRSNGTEMEEIAATADWETDLSRSVALTRSCYAHVPAGTPLWVARNEFTPADPALITTRLEPLKPG